MLNPAEPFLGPYGVVVLLLAGFAAGAPWVKSMIDARLASLERSLVQYQEQIHSMNLQILELTKENAVLRERLSTLEKHNV